MNIRKKLIGAMILIIAIPSLVWASDLNRAVVKIYAVYNKYDYYSPWQMQGPGTGNGSGCIISGKRILTNAHVVSDQTFIQVQRAGYAKKYTAELITIDHECDLAILKVKDDSFFSDIKHLEIGELPKVKDDVAVYGFPIGGKQLSITKGCVSRIENSGYTHSNANLLNCQVDAPINSGNSGGPVIKNGKIIGIAFEAIEEGENIGYMVPTPVINHFLKDIEDNEYHGFPDLGISWQKMESSAMRSKFMMNEKQTGILINKIYPDSSARRLLKPEDIILSIDNINVDNDGTIEFRKDERTSFNYILQSKHINDTVNLELLRKGKIVNTEVVLTKPVNSGLLVPHQQYDVSPSYYIVGGLVFEKFTLSYLEEWGESWFKNAPKNLLNYYCYGEPKDGRKEIIVLIRVLADEINVGYHSCEDEIISYINGKKISTMKDLIDAFEKHQGQYHTIVDEYGFKIVLDKSETDKHSQRILEKYRIKTARSADLQYPN